ncbi:MAG: excinuclease ABC subunit UvrC [Calditrichota bacterium]
MSRAKNYSLDLRAKLDNLPDRPGIYIFKDGSGETIYVGKAKSLRNRVRTYFTSADDGRYQYPRLVAAIRDLEVLLTRDEVEALRTEQSIIRQLRPRYNVELRDDKSYLFLKVTRETFPRIFLTRKPHIRDGEYFGPFTDARSARTMVRVMKGILHIRDCSLPLTPEKIEQRRFKVCLDYHIGRCGGPCIGCVSDERYSLGIKRFLEFVKGRHDDILILLEEEMRALAEQLRFEEAAQARDRLLAARRFTERMIRVCPEPVNRDAVNFAREDSYAAFSVINVRSGRIVGQSPFHMEKASGLDDPALLEAFLLRLIDLTRGLSEEVLLPLEPPDIPSLESYLSEAAGHRVKFFIPQRGEKNQLVQLALANAEHLLAERRLIAEKRDWTPRSIKALQECLNLPHPPKRIEAFDVSHLQGVDTLASMVVFQDGRPLKSDYRVFKMKTVEGIDDFASIGEAVSRRYRRLTLELAHETADPTGGESNNPAARPDLTLIDGGAGQLSRAKAVLNELGLSELPVIGLAKRLEEIYLPDTRDPLILPKTSSALRLLQQIRDEAHRFAVTRQRLLRGKRLVKSQLDEIPGIGPIRRQALLKRFGSLKRIRESTADEIASTPGMTRKLAELVLKELGEA